MQITSISSYWFLGILETAKKDLVLVFPALHEEWLHSLERIVQQKQISLKICVNNTEESIRHGHGSSKQFKLLSVLKAVVRQNKDLKVQYLRVDQRAFFFFNDSLLINEFGAGQNAVEIRLEDALSLELILFPPPTTSQTEGITGVSKEVISLPFNEEQAKAIEESLEKNPPIAPDLKRQLEMYTTRFQYVEIEFKGSKFAEKRIKLPRNTLPVNDADLLRAIESTLRVFDYRNFEIRMKALKLTTRLDQIKDSFLRKNKDKNKWVLDKKYKSALESDIEKLRADIEQAKQSLMAILKCEIDQTKLKVENELIAFYNKNIPATLQALSGIALSEALNKYVLNLTLKIKFPDPELLLNDLDLVVRYFDLTEQDINDEKLIEWFKVQGLLPRDEQSKIANYQKAFGTKLT